MVLGSATVLRAGTDLHVVPAAVGAGAGLALALGLVASGIAPAPRTPGQRGVFHVRPRSPSRYR